MSRHVSARFVSCFHCSRRMKEMRAGALQRCATSARPWEISAGVGRRLGVSPRGGGGAQGWRGGAMMSVEGRFGGGRLGGGGNGRCAFLCQEASPVWHGTTPRKARDPPEQVILFGRHGSRGQGDEGRLPCQAFETRGSGPLFRGRYARGRRVFALAGVVCFSNGRAWTGERGGAVRRFRRRH